MSKDTENKDPETKENHSDIHSQEIKQSEEHHGPATPQPITAEEKKKTKPVLVYMGLLVIVVIALLLLSYFMQHRNTEELQNLNQTVSSMQDTYDAMSTINDMQATISDQLAEIEDLEDQVDQYEDQVEELEEELDDAQIKLSDTETENDNLSLELSAVEYMLDLEIAYNAEDYDSCMSILEEMSDYIQYLPDEYTERYSELKDQIETHENLDYEEEENITENTE